MRMMPYTVIRDKQVVTLATSTTAATNLVYLLGPFQALASGYTIPRIGVWGIGTGVPTSGENAIALTNISSTVLGRFRLHRFAATVSCTGCNAAGVTPDGVVGLGVLRGPIDRSAFATYNALGTYLLGRQEVEQVSNYSLMVQPARVVGYALDRVSYDQFSLIGSTPNASDLMSDAMAPIAVVLPNTVAVVSITVTIHSEWTVMYSSDPILQSTHTTHSHGSDTLWEEAWSGAEAVAGLVGIGAAADRGGWMPQLARGAQGAARLAGRAIG